MSNINYDVTYPVSYNSAYKHYLARYKIHIQAYKGTLTYTYWDGHHIKDWYDLSFEAAVSFDAGNEITVSGSKEYWTKTDGSRGDDTMWITVPVQDLGPFENVYIRNPHPENRVFNYSNTGFTIDYTTKAEFKIQFNSVGFAANQNASFRCSTIAQNCLSQYEWASAVVYYKKSTESSYSSVAATVSGSWSDVKVSTTFGFTDGFTYDVYIKATADDGTTAQTPVAQFTSTDADAVATCISPVGAFTNGEVKFAWAHSTEYGTPQHAYDLRYSANNGGSWTTVKTHEVTTASSITTHIDAAGSYIWQVRTYNSNDVVGEWVQAAFVNNVPATSPTNISVTTKGRPTVEWITSDQSAYQVQALLGDEIVYDSGAVYSAQTSHIINKYMQDLKAYTIRVRIYNALGDVSEWVSTGYQQPTIPDVSFDIEQDANGGIDIIISENSEFIKYYILRNGKPIAVASSATYYDRFAIGDVNYSVVGVTSADNSDIKSKGIKAVYPKATIVTLSGESYAVNKRFNEAYEIKTASDINYNKAQFIGDSKPIYYPDQMVTKSFSITCFDENNDLEKLLGQTVFYADNFGNGGFCFVSSYSKQDDYLQSNAGIYANEITLTLGVTNYDDSIKYEL